jgi:hypothetical protein
MTALVLIIISPKMDSRYGRSSWRPLRLTPAKIKSMLRKRSNHPEGGMNAVTTGNSVRALLPVVLNWARVMRMARGGLVFGASSLAVWSLISLLAKLPFYDWAQWVTVAAGVTCGIVFGAKHGSA